MVFLGLLKMWLKLRPLFLPIEHKCGHGLQKGHDLNHVVLDEVDPAMLPKFNHFLEKCPYFGLRHFVFRGLIFYSSY